MKNLIGNTPCVMIPYNNSKIYIKLEEFNWGGSVKSRVGYQMIIDAESDGRIDTRFPNKITIIEGTGGNTGIGVAQICAQRGYRCILVVPDNYSPVRVNILRQLGAEVFLSDHKKGNDSHIIMVEEILADNPNYIYLNQVNNPSNVKAHYLGTGKEIINQVDEKITHFVAGVGSGGTLTGAGKALKEYDSSIKVIAVQPEGCDVLHGKAFPHKIEGIAIGRIPGILDYRIIDSSIDINENEVISYRSVFSKKTGFFLGYSSIANILACMKLAQDTEGIYVTVAPDGGRNYME